MQLISQVFQMSRVPANKVHKRYYGISEDQPFLLQRIFFPTREGFALVRYCNDHTNNCKKGEKE